MVVSSSSGKGADWAPLPRLSRSIRRVFTSEKSGYDLNLLSLGEFYESISGNAAKVSKEKTRLAK
jgi:hypothetical protein